MKTSLIQSHQAHIDLIEARAASLHASVNQLYGHDLPYAFHLRLAATYLTRFSDDIPMDDDNIETLYAAVYFHDSLEDTRITYNDLKKLLQSLNEQGCTIQVTEAAEMVYALTNDKGRTRAERAGEQYYQGIRTTPFAAILKLCDRLANVRFSTLFLPEQRMVQVYRDENAHFLEAVTTDAVTPVPQAMIAELSGLLFH